MRRHFGAESSKSSGIFIFVLLVTLISIGTMVFLHVTLKSSIDREASAYTDSMKVTNAEYAETKERIYREKLKR